MLKELVGRKISIWSCAGEAEHRDDGMLENYDETFLVLRKNDERLYFVLRNIRLIKAT
jgi:hypothetical protein